MLSVGREFWERKICLVSSLGVLGEMWVSVGILRAVWEREICLVSCLGVLDEIWVSVGIFRAVWERDLLANSWNLRE